MNIKTVLATTVIGALLIMPSPARDKLEAKAKISKAEAEKTALAKVPGGKIKDSEIEEENGKLIWSFDISKQGTKDITEVNVDAMTGEVVSVEQESAAKEAAEKAREAKEKSKKKAGKHDKDDDEKQEK